MRAQRRQPTDMLWGPAASVFITPTTPRLTLRFSFFFFLVIGRPPRSTLFPYTPLFRSVFDPPTPPLDSTLAVGGAPSARSILRVVLPRAIRDSSQIIRATLILVPAVPVKGAPSDSLDRKSTRLNSSHGYISYAVFCLKK